MPLFVKSFDQLSVEELYDILRLRVAVFVVEQRCSYQELDGLDQEALHVYWKEGEEIQAYLRVMDRGPGRPYVSLGRVLTVPRRQGWGRKILAQGIRVAREAFHGETLYLEAQVYAKGLYEAQGFRAISEEFLEDGIPHVKMLLEGPQ